MFGLDTQESTGKYRRRFGLLPWTFLNECARPPRPRRAAPKPRRSEVHTGLSGRGSAGHTPEVCNVSVWNICARPRGRKGSRRSFVLVFRAQPPAQRSVAPAGRRDPGARARPTAGPRRPRAHPPRRDRAGGLRRPRHPPAGPRAERSRRWPPGRALPGGGPAYQASPTGRSAPRPAAAPLTRERERAEAGGSEEDSFFLLFFE